MELIGRDDILKKYAEVVSNKRKYSNCYFSVAALGSKIEEQKVYALEIREAFIIIQKEPTFHYLYFVCNSWEWLLSIEDIKKEFPQLVVSIVQKGKLDLQKPFLDYGYSVYKIYQRLRNIKISKADSMDIEVEYCISKDKKALNVMMRENFDVLSDHIPSDQELDDFLREKKIICVRKKGTLAGFIIFEDKGKTSYIRMVCIAQNFREKGIGNYLMEKYFAIHRNYVSFTLWYDMKNYPAYSLYHKWGYEEEKMYNYIFLL